MIFLTPREHLYFVLDDCHQLNSTCGVDIDTLKRLVCSIWICLLIRMIRQNCLIFSWFHMNAMALFWIFNSMSATTTIARRYSNGKQLKWAHASQQTPFISSKIRTNQIDSQEWGFFHFFSNYDVQQLPLTYGRNDMQRKFTFDFIPNELYRPHVSNTSTKCILSLNSQKESKGILNLQNVFRIDFHTQSRGFSEF